MRDYKCVKVTRNLKVGDGVRGMDDPRIQVEEEVKWGIVESVHLDHDGVVRDVIVRYSLLKPGPEPYITTFSKKSPFKANCVVFKLLH